MYPSNEEPSKEELLNEIRSIKNQLKEQVNEISNLNLENTRLNALVGAGYEGIAITKKGLFVYTNQQFAELAGYTDNNELVGLKVADFVAEESKELVKKHILSGYDKPYEHAMIRKDGSKFIVEVYGKSVELQGEQYRITTIRDVTERHNAENRLRESEIRYRRLFDNSPISSWEEDFSEIIHYLEKLNYREIDDFEVFLLSNPDVVQTCASKVKILDVNRASLSLFDARSKHHLIENLTDTFTDESYEVFIRELIEIQRGHLNFSTETTHKTLKGDILNTSIHISVVPGYEHDFSRIIISIVDLTALKQAEEEKNKLQSQILHSQKLESLGVLAGGIAHDFNNLLVGIMGNASLALARTTTDNSISELLLEIEKTSQQAAELSKQMLAYSGKGSFKVEVCNLTSIIEDITPLIDISISKSVNMNYDLSKSLPNIEADITQIKQIILNLITNASEAITSDGGVISIRTGTIEVDKMYLMETYVSSDLPGGEYVFFEVVDSGEGISKEDMKKIFDPFYTTKFTGRGLGLAVVLGIIRGHNGSIKVHSEQGKGSNFRILLPTSFKPMVTRKSKGEIVYPKRKGIVLLIDDEKTVRKVGKKMLQEIGYEVLLASDGNEGLELFKENMKEISIIILDLTMPQMDGATTYQKIRNIDSRIPVILSSGFDKQDTTNRLDIDGLAGFLQKPYNLDSLMDLLSEILNHN
ncbi:MAG: PAS domain-containing hybrid sensor histidine kinase/response regulator [Candidatus Kariarchaeaceae archaeon]